MDPPASLAWLVDEAGVWPGPESFLAELGDPRRWVPLGEHVLRDVAAPCAVFTLPDA